MPSSLSASSSTECARAGVSRAVAKLQVRRPEATRADPGQRVVAELVQGDAPEVVAVRPELQQVAGGARRPDARS